MHERRNVESMRVVGMNTRWWVGEGRIWRRRLSVPTTPRGPVERNIGRLKGSFIGVAAGRRVSDFLPAAVHVLTCASNAPRRQWTN